MTDEWKPDNSYRRWLHTSQYSDAVAQNIYYFDLQTKVSNLLLIFIPVTGMFVWEDYSVITQENFKFSHPHSHYRLVDAFLDSLPYGWRVAVVSAMTLLFFLIIASAIWRLNAPALVFGNSGVSAISLFWGRLQFPWSKITSTPSEIIIDGSRRFLRTQMLITNEDWTALVDNISLRSSKKS